MAEVPVYHLNLNTNYQLITKPKVGGVEVPIAIFSFEDPQHGWRHYSLAPEATIKIQDALNKAWPQTTTSLIVPGSEPDVDTAEASNARLFGWLHYILSQTRKASGISAATNYQNFIRAINHYADRAISGDDPPEGFA